MTLILPILGWISFETSLPMLHDPFCYQNYQDERCRFSCCSAFTRIVPPKGECGEPIVQYELSKSTEIARDLHMSDEVMSRPGWVDRAFLATLSLTVIATFVAIEECIRLSDQRRWRYAPKAMQREQWAHETSECEGRAPALCGGRIECAKLLFCLRIPFPAPTIVRDHLRSI
jgi:hypothetical protein